MSAHLVNHMILHGGWCSILNVVTIFCNQIRLFLWDSSGISMELNLFHGIHMDCSMESCGIHVDSIWNWSVHDHSILIPCGIHDVHGIRNWLGSQPTFIPWIPYGIPHGFHGFHMDAIWNNLGKVKTSIIETPIHGAKPIRPASLPTCLNPYPYLQKPLPMVEGTGFHG